VIRSGAMVVRALAFMLAACSACASPEKPAAKPSAPARVPAATAPSPGISGSALVKANGVERASPGANARTEKAEADAAQPTPCGELGCLAFETPEAAFDHVLRRSPRVLAIGEAHAQKGASVESGAKRFTERLLPRLSGKASDLVIEVWVATGKCGKVEQKVARQQAPVTENQASTNQDEFLAMGHRAKALGIEPHALVPSCDEYAQIAGAGAADVDRMLRMIAERTARDVSALLDRRAARTPAGARGPMIVAYGGALHNDRVPRTGREHWAFGPALHAKTAGAYVELDLIVPEFVKDSDSWRAFAWFDAYRRSTNARGAVLYETSENAFTLIFPRAEARVVSAPE
jgi:hypothetical protein